MSMTPEQAFALANKPMEDISEDFISTCAGTVNECYVHKQGKLIIVERLHITNIAPSTSSNTDIATIDEKYYPNIDNWIRFLFQVYVGSNGKLDLGFLRGTTGIMTLFKQSSSSVVELYSVGFSYFCA